MSLLSTTVYTPPLYTCGFFDYITGNSFGGNPLNGEFILPDFFNKHTIWLAQWMFPAGLLSTNTILKAIQGLTLDFSNDQNGSDYIVQFFRPCASSNAAGTLAAAALNGPSFITQRSINAQYTYGVGGGSSGLANVVATFANDWSMTLPLGTVSSTANFIDHFTPDAMVCCALGGSNTSPLIIAVSNMAICNAINVGFTSNKIKLTVPNISTVMSPTTSQPYWAYGAFLIRSEQV